MAALPFEILNNDLLGRHLVANKSIEIGSVILQEPPLVRGPFLHTIPVCLGCGKILDETSRPCTKCGWPMCSQTCEAAPQHYPECTLTAARGGILITNFGITHPNYQFVTLLRALYLKKSSPEKWERLMQLQSSSVNVNLAPTAFTKSFLKLEEWSEEEIEKISGILTVNGHELPFSEPCQLVVYDTASLLEHNCMANCSKTFSNDGEIVIVAVEDINQGDHLTICYTDPFWGVENRRRHLHQSKNFWCSCARCIDPLEFGTYLNSVKCLQSPSCDGYLLPKTFLEKNTAWNCDKCTSSVSIQDIVVILEKVGSELAEMPKGDAEACKQFVQKYEKILSPHHFYLFEVKMVLIHMLASGSISDLSDKDLALLLELCDNLTVVAQKIAPAERRFLGLTFYAFAKATIEAARRQQDPEGFITDVKKSKELLSQAYDLLINEPTLLQEGCLRMQIDLEIKHIDKLLCINK